LLLLQRLLSLLQTSCSWVLKENRLVYKAASASVTKPAHTLFALLLLLLLCLLQTSCSWVLKESRAVYKAASEGVMNLADKFFEMERAQALQVRHCAMINSVYSRQQHPKCAATSKPQLHSGLVMYCTSVYDYEVQC
jgi:hypothetical protein